MSLKFLTREILENFNLENFRLCGNNCVQFFVAIYMYKLFLGILYTFYDTGVDKI